MLLYRLLTYAKFGGNLLVGESLQEKAKYVNLPA
jgi:hypothetical protein